MAKNSGKGTAKKGSSCAFEDLIGIPKMPNLKTLLNPLSSLEPLTGLAFATPSMLESILPGKTLVPLSAVSTLNSAISPRIGVMQAFVDDSLIKNARAALTSPLAHLKPLLAPKPAFAGIRPISGIKSIVPPVPPTPELISLGNALSSVTAALRALEEPYRSIKQMQERFAAEAQTVSVAMQSIFRSSSLLSESLMQPYLRLDREYPIMRHYAGTRSAVSVLQFPIDSDEAALLDQSILSPSDLVKSELQLPGNLIEVSDPVTEGILAHFLSQCRDVSSDAIKWLLTNKISRASLKFFLEDIPKGLLIYYIIHQINLYPVTSISNQTIDYRNEYLPGEPLGKIANGGHTLYSEPSKRSDPRWEVSEGQKVILCEEESNGWRKVLVVRKNKGDWHIYEGWIEESGYDAIP